MDKLIDAMKRVNDLNKSHGVTQRGGKKYTEVSVRVEAFRTVFGVDMGIDTAVLVDDGKRVVIKAMILDSTGRVVGSGMAEEIRGSSNVNKTSALENCETSAIGRALASIGLHGGTYASANEIAAVARKEQAQQEQAKPAPKPAPEKPVSMPPGFEEPGTGYMVLLHTGEPYKAPVESIDDAMESLVGLMRVYAKTETNRAGESVSIRERMTMIRELREQNIQDLISALTSEDQLRFDALYKKILASLGAKMNEENNEG